MRSFCETEWSGGGKTLFLFIDITFAEQSTYVPPQGAYDSQLEAQNQAALRMLHKLCGSLNLIRIIPPQYKASWKDLDQVFFSTPPLSIAHIHARRQEAAIESAKEAERAKKLEERKAREVNVFLDQNCYRNSRVLGSRLFFYFCFRGEKGKSVVTGGWTVFLFSDNGEKKSGTWKWLVTSKCNT